MTAADQAPGSQVGAEHPSALARAIGLIREIPDFPEPGVLFRDIGPMLSDRSAFSAVIDALGNRHEFDVVAGVEARGFLLGAAVAYSRGAGIVALRKPGKLPMVADRVDYELEYGTASLELAPDALRPGQRVLIIDDVLATGGTLAGACELVRRAGAELVGAEVVLELTALGGRAAISEEFHALLAV